MANLFVFHGAYGHPEENWFPWLKQEVEKLGHEVIIPSFPTPENQTLENWLETIEPYLPQVNEKTIMVGHSSGGIFLLRLLEKLDTKIEAAIPVAAPVKEMGNKFDELNKTFVFPAVDWERVKNKAEHFYLIYSDNDPYVPLEHGEITARGLEVPLVKVPGAGHFNIKAGYNRFELLLDLIKKEI